MSPLGLRRWYGYFAMLMIVAWVNSSSPSWPISTPMPDCFAPPNGVSGPTCRGACSPRPCRNRSWRPPRTPGRGPTTRPSRPGRSRCRWRVRSRRRCRSSAAPAAPGRTAPREPAWRRRGCRGRWSAGRSSPPARARSPPATILPCCRASSRNPFTFSNCCLFWIGPICVPCSSPSPTTVCPRELAQLVAEGVVDRIVDIEPLDGEADLAGVEHGGGIDLRRHFLRVDVVEHDRRVVAAELQGQALQAVRRRSPSPSCRSRSSR